MFDYRKSQETALSLISNFGFEGTIRRFVESSYDPILGEDTNETFTDHKAKMVSITGYEGGKLENIFFEGFNLSRNRVFFVAAKGLSIEPQLGDIIIDNDNVSWDIGREGTKGGITPLKPSTLSVMFICSVTVSGRKL